jgi:hypothetical protein
MEEATALTGAGAIEAWRFLSRMHQLALELNTGMRHSRGPILRSMYLEGLLPTELRSTRANKLRVLRVLCDVYAEAVPGWAPSGSVARALGD